MLEIAQKKNSQSLPVLSQKTAPLRPSHQVFLLFFLLNLCLICDSKSTSDHRDEKPPKSIASMRQTIISSRLVRWETTEKIALSLLVSFFLSCTCSGPRSRGKKERKKERKTWIKLKERRRRKKVGRLWPRFARQSRQSVARKEIRHVWWKSFLLIPLLHQEVGRSVFFQWKGFQGPSQVILLLPLRRCLWFPFVLSRCQSHPCLDCVDCGCPEKDTNPAARTAEAAHVFNHSKDWEMRFATKGDFLAHISDRDLLWCCDDDSAVWIVVWEVLHNRNVLIGGSRWRVDDQKVQFAPTHILKKLLDRGWIQR